jgi:hypothetical protein
MGIVCSLMGSEVTELIVKSHYRSSISMRESSLIHYLPFKLVTVSSKLNLLPNFPMYEFGGVLLSIAK